MRWLALCLLCLACDDGGAADGADAQLDPDVSVPVDMTSPLPDAMSVDAAPTPDARTIDAGPAHSPRPRPMAAADMVAPRQWRFARGLIHMHSVHSHDACDGEPKPDGVPDATCLARFRAAACHNRLDYLLLTDHPGSFEDIPFEEAFLHQDGDTWERGADGPIANRVACPDGHEVLLTAGSEGDLMPVMFRQKPPQGSLRDRSPEGVATLKAAGALVFQAHMERFTAEQVAPLGLDGMEIYNLHANLDPRGELMQLGEVLPGLAQWINAGAAGPHPDLTFLAVFRENPLALGVWDGLTPTTRILGFAGSDIHENLPPIVRPGDGERMDSYRRLGRWFGNYLLVESVDYAGVRAALEAQRAFVAFDLWGPPTGFDFHAVRPGGQVLEMGSEVAFERGLMLRGAPPTAPAGSFVSVRLRRVTAEASEVVQNTDRAFEFEVPVPGVYRVEVWLTPEHLRPELGELADRFMRPVVWIYSNPIYVR